MYGNLTIPQIAYMLATNQVTTQELANHLSQAQIEELEDYVFAVVAVKTAGGDHMVHWEASEEIH